MFKNIWLFFEIALKKKKPVLFEAWGCFQSDYCSNSGKLLLMLWFKCFDWQATLTLLQEIILIQSFYTKKMIFLKEKCFLCLLVLSNFCQILRYTLKHNLYSF